MSNRVSLFVTCMVDQLFPKVGMAMADVLERLGYRKARHVADSRRSTAVIGAKRALWRATF
jgi:hypothetical protein